MRYKKSSGGFIDDILNSKLFQICSPLLIGLILILRGPLAIVIAGGAIVYFILIIPISSLLNSYCVHKYYNGVKRCPICSFESSQKIAAEHILYEQKLRTKSNESNWKDLIKNERNRLISNKFEPLYNMQALTSREFELYIAYIYRKLGYKVNVTTATNDGGIDLNMYKDERKIVVECKKYSTKNKIGREAIQKFHSAAINAKYNEGVFITTSDFFTTAKEYAKGKNITLINGKKLISLIREVYPVEEISVANIPCPECLEIVFYRKGSYVTQNCSKGHKVIFPGYFKNYM